MHNKTCEITFWATFGKVWATFYFTIWSHCAQPKRGKCNSHMQDGTKEGKQNNRWRLSNSDSIIKLK